MATIKDVAERANVSISTVSNVINNKGGVGEDVYQRVLAAMRELQYRPNIIARNLKRQKTRFIAVVMPNVYGHYATILYSIQRSLENLGYYCILKLTDDDPTTEKAVLRNLLEVGLSGMLVIPADPENIDFYDEIISREIPVVFMERRIMGAQFSSVIFDGENVAYDITGQLIQKYGEDISLVVGSLKFSSEQEYVNGFNRAYERYTGRPYDGTIVVSSMNKEQAFYSLFSSIMQMDRLPACFLVSNTQVGKALVEVLREIHDKAYVVSMDVADWCLGTEGENQNDRELRVSAKNALELGQSAVSLLQRYIKEQPVFENISVVIKQQDPSPDPVDYPALCSGDALRVLLLESPTADSLIKQSVGFSRRYNCKFEFESLSYLSLYERIVEEMKAGRASHDVLMVDLPWLREFEEHGYLHDMTPVMESGASFLDSYNDTVRKFFIHDESKIFGLPVMGTTQALFYRKDLFRDSNLQRAFVTANGFEMKPPINWTEFNLIARFFTREFTPSSPVEFGTTICGIASIGLANEFYPRQWAFGGRMLDANGTPCVTSLNNVRALSSLRDTFKVSHTDSFNFWWDDGFRELLNGHTAMVQSFYSHFPTAANAENMGRHSNDIGYAPIPGNKPMMGGWALGVNRNSKKLRAAYGYIRWAVSEELSTQNTLLGGALPLKATTGNAAIKLMMPWMQSAEKNLAVSGRRELIHNDRGMLIDAYQLDNDLGEQIKKAITDEIAVEEALDVVNNKLLGLMYG
jgi:DNA-binding LacI/PurR family transcriptional regulator/ABC-type glycerol-3-phosphate transport system substrate-binding protein